MTSINSYTEERVSRNNDICECNCGSTGDFVCDTPPDPYFTNDPGGVWNGPMFSACALENDDNEEDDCDEKYTDPNSVLHKNIMSYLNSSLCGVPQLMPGQNMLIRKTLAYPDGSYKYQMDPNEMPFSMGETINSPQTKNADEAFDGDLVVNSDLTIENCTIELTEGHKIIVNAGAKLTIRNATLRTYTGGICYFPMEGKKDWEGIEISPSSSNLTSISVLSNATIDVSEAGIYNVEGSSGFLNLAFNNSTLNGPAISLSKTIGSQKLLKSNFNRTVSVTDNFYLQVSGCSFDLNEDNHASGIKAENTHLAVEAGYGHVRSSFANCGNGIEFISSSAHSCKVTSTDFDQVLSGINAESTAGFFSAHDCTVAMRDPSGTFSFGKGILLDNFIDFEIYDNDITGIGSGSQKGIELKHMELNDNPNLIINNTIKDCEKGIFSAAASLGNSMSGVEFECNTMINIQFENFHTNRIGPHQGRGGDIARPAGNKFDGSTMGFQDFNYEGGGFSKKTYHYRDLGLENIVNYNPAPLPSGVPLFETNRLTGGEVPQCNYPPVPNDPSTLPLVITDRKQSFDGGDTGGSVNSILTDSDDDPTSVITDIIGNSPWVSVPVVQTLFDYSQYYTQQEIANIIIQNPGVLDDTYINAIAFDSGSFSAANLQAMINAYQAGDVRMAHEGALVDPILEGTLHIKNTLHAEMNNETFDQASIRSAVADKISYTKLYQTVESHLMDQDYQGAMAALNAKQDFENFDPHLLIEKTTYAEIIQMEAHLYAQGEPWTKLPATDYNRLVSIANMYNGVATIKARNILKIYFEMQFGAQPSKPNYNPLIFAPSSLRSMRDEAVSVQVFPNPAYDVLNIVLDDVIENGTFRLVDVNGKLVKSQTILAAHNQINLSGIDHGIYFYEITQGGILLSSNKIIILK